MARIAAEYKNLYRRHHRLQFERNVGRQHLLRANAQRFDGSRARARLCVDAGQIYQPPYPPIAGLLDHRSVCHQWRIQQSHFV